MTRRRHVAIALLLAVSLGCAAATRHRVLTVFFDGVPPLEEELVVSADGGTATLREAGRPRLPRPHGPYAAKLCSACHRSPSDNSLVAPKEELCGRCHALRLDRRYVHGPLASGGCLVCHDPHASKFGSLLVADSAVFCVSCHEPSVVAKVEAHAGNAEPCTSCHDAHMSDTRYLLRAR